MPVYHRSAIRNRSHEASSLPLGSVPPHSHSNDPVPLCFCVVGYAVQRSTGQLRLGHAEVQRDLAPAADMADSASPEWALGAKFAAAVNIGEL
jgi:hypothetical protein